LISFIFDIMIVKTQMVLLEHHEKYQIESLSVSFLNI